MKDFKTIKLSRKEKPTLLEGFSDAFVSGTFCDVKVVCKDTNLWAHRLVLGSVSPFLYKLLIDFEKRGDDVITIFLPLIKGYHMKLVLDYIYSGAMYLCGAHMQYVIQVMEVLQLECGVSVNKMVYSGGTLKGKEDWIEIEHSTMRIKTDDKLESLRKDLSKEVSSTSNIPHCKLSSDESLSHQTSESNCQRSSKLKVSLDTPDEIKIEKILDHSRINGVGVVTGNINTSATKGKPDIVNGLHPSENAESDMVMVELDEEFVVEMISTTESEADPVTEVIGEPLAPTHRCVLCGRAFRHYMNLQVHLTGHLGVKVNLNRCSACKRNFRNKNELDLHIRSHKFAKLLGKYRVKKTKKNLKAPKIITTVGSKERKILRKYIKKAEPTLVSKCSKKISISRSKQLKKIDNLTCGLCDKSFGVKSIYMRHIQKCHPDLAVTLESHTLLQTRPCVEVKKVSLVNEPPKLKTPSRTSPTKSSESDTATPGRTGTPNRTFATPLSKGKEMLKSVMNSNKTKEISRQDSGIPELPDYYNTLECPDCGRVFIAKSIFERHLQSAKHGIYSMYSSESEYYQTPPKSTAEFWAAADKLRASSDSDSGVRIECHLCGQTFVRVKDLAKHREKMCQAYHSGKT